MLRFRTLLIDTESSYRRPIQAFFNNMWEVNDWTRKVLSATNNKHAWVEIYEVTEREIGRVSRQDLPLMEKEKEQEKEKEKEKEKAANDAGPV